MPEKTTYTTECSKAISHWPVKLYYLAGSMKEIVKQPGNRPIAVKSWMHIEEIELSTLW